jgi:hypothetical protein
MAVWMIMGNAALSILRKKLTRYSSACSTPIKKTQR